MRKTKVLRDTNMFRVHGNFNEPSSPNSTNASCDKDVTRPLTGCEAMNGERRELQKTFRALDISLKPNN